MCLGSCRVPIILNFCKPDGFRQSGRVVCRCRVPIINNREIRAAALGTSLEVIWPPTGYDHSDDDDDDGGGGYNDQHGV